MEFLPGPERSHECERGTQKCVRHFRSSILRLPALLLALLPIYAQTSAPTFPAPNWFRQHLGSPNTRVELQAPAQIADAIVDGKLQLSLRDYIELALRNNTDIALAKLQVLSPANAIARAFGAFDPALAASFSNTRATQPTSSALQGASTLKSLSQPVDLTYQQLLPTGATMIASYDALRSSSNNSFSTFNPAISDSLSVSFDQPLLRNRGARLTRLNILLARSNLRISRYQLRDQVSSLLAGAENAYWDVVQARENLVLQTKFMELRDAALQRAQKQLEAGALLPLDIFQPKADYASAQVAVIQARQALAHAENSLRVEIGADLDSSLRALPIVLTEPLNIAAATLPDRETAIRSALASRPDRLAAATTLDADDINIRSATDALRPGVSLTGSYTSQGLGGIFNQLTDPFGNSTAVTRIPGGFADALSQLFGFGFPVYSFGLRLNLPIRDRAAAANLSDAQIRKRQDALQLRKLEQNLRLQVLNAVDDLEAIRASMQQAESAREFAEKRFAAEQKKYELGVTQLFFVLDAQTQLNAAENDVLRQNITYRRALINLYLMTGELLAERHVTLD
jgi:outer membrane protein